MSDIWTSILGYGTVPLGLYLVLLEAAKLGGVQYRKSCIKNVFIHDQIWS